MLKIGEADIYPDQDLIRCNGAETALTPRSMDVLVYLAERPGVTVSAEALLQAVWANDYIADNAVHKAVSEIRHALRDDHQNPRYIRTVRKRGYRLIARVDSGSSTSPFAAQVLSATQPSASIRSIAVLPFENLSGDPEQDYLAAGLHEEVITALAKIEALDVRSRSSVRYLTEVEKPMSEIAQDLGVATVVEGSVTRDSTHMRITVQLIDGPSDTHLWNHSFTRPVDNALGLQNELALKIANEIDATLTPEDRVRLTSIPTLNPGAYHAYLRAQVARNDFLPESVLEAIAHFEHAIELDPEFAAAWAGLSGALYMTAGNIMAPVAHETMPHAKAAALRAIEVDEGLADAHYALANVYFSYEWDWAQAEREFEIACALQAGNDPVFSSFHANFLAAMGRGDEAIAMARDALARAPREPLIRANLVIVYNILGLYERALAEAIAAIELAPDDFAAHLVTIYAAYATGDAARAVESRAKISELLGMPDIANGFRSAFVSEGWKGFAEFSLEHTLWHPHSTGNLPYLVELGRLDDAFATLELAIEARDVYLVFIRGYSFFPPALRADPRFDAIVRRVGLPNWK